MKKADKHFRVLLVVTCFISLVAFIGSCKEQNTVGFNGQLSNDIAQIDDYLKQHNITATADPSGLRYSVSSVGTAGTSKPGLKDSVRVGYNAFLIPTGELVSATDTITFKLSDVVPAWQMALPRYSQGAVVTLFVPSGLAFGASAKDNIPANANLIFNISLIKVIKK